MKKSALLAVVVAAGSLGPVTSFAQCCQSGIEQVGEMYRQLYSRYGYGDVRIRNGDRRRDRQSDLTEDEADIDCEECVRIKEASIFEADSRFDPQTGKRKLISAKLQAYADSVALLECPTGIGSKLYLPSTFTLVKKGVLVGSAHGIVEEKEVRRYLKEKGLEVNLRNSLDAAKLVLRDCTLIVTDNNGKQLETFAVKKFHAGGFLTDSDPESDWSLIRIDGESEYLKNPARLCPTTRDALYETKVVMIGQHYDIRGNKNFAGVKVYPKVPSEGKFHRGSKYSNLEYMVLHDVDSSGVASGTLMLDEKMRCGVAIHKGGSENPNAFAFDGRIYFNSATVIDETLIKVIDNF